MTPLIVGWKRRLAQVALLACVAVLTQPTEAGGGRSGKTRTSKRASRKSESASVRTWSAKLKNKDFRVRTQAALRLGATSSSSAVKPLCGALGDRNAAVRAAAAAALGKLQRGGRSCLSSRLKKERSLSVKQALRKALDDTTLDEPKPPTSATRYYVALGETTDQSGRAAGEVAKLVRAAMVKALDGMPEYAIAPAAEAPSAAKRVLGKHRKLEGFYLWPKVRKPSYAAGKLTVIVELAIFTYPKKVLRGSLPIKLSIPGVSAKDVESEDQLIDMAAARAISKFAQNVERL